MATMKSAEFEEAIKAFTARMSAEEVRDFKHTNVQDLEAAIVKIREKQTADRKLRYLQRLDPIVKILRQYGQVIEIFVNVSNIVAFVWGPMKFLLEISSTFFEAFDRVLDAYQNIGESMPQVIQYQKLFNESPHMRTVLVLIYQDLLEFHKEALRYFRSKVWKKLIQATWRGFVSKIDKIVANMKRHQSLLDTGASIVQFEKIQMARSEAENNFQLSRQAEMDRKRLAVSQWLAAASSDDVHTQCVRAREGCPRSGRWILENPRFKKWIHPVFCETPALWLNGSPGIGKSVLSSVIIEEIGTFNDANAAYFYCKYEDTERNTFVAVAKGILSHLFTLSNDIVSYLYEKSSRSGETSLSSPKLAKELLDTVLGFCQKTYIVIDGLDECSREERKEICLYFRNIVKSLPRSEADRIRCLFVSQDDGYARKDLSTLPSLKITENDNREDIASFVKIWDEKLRNRFHFEVGLHDIAKLILSFAKGTFLFARLVVNHLYSQPSLKEFEQELRPDIFPKGINEAYDRILKRIFDGSAVSQQNASKTLLGWLVCARRRMKWREIQGAVSVDLQESTVDLTRRFVDDSKDLAASLVELYPDGSVELVHSSAKKYLTESGYVDRNKVDYDLALLCLEYLGLPYLQLPAIDDEGQPEHLEILLDGYYALLDYASVFWVSHLEAGIPSNADVNLVDALARAAGNFTNIHSSNTQAKLTVSKTFRARLDVFKDELCFESLAQAAVFAKKQLGPFGKGPGDEDPLKLFPLIARIRKIFEDPSFQATDAQRAELVDLYGPNWFKCLRMNCKYFHEGFSTKNDRDHHAARHERAFFCSFEGCPEATFGFVTAKDLEKHLHDDHDIMTTDDTEFPAVNPHKSLSKGTGTIPCPHCGQMFTRQYNMRSHVRERHERGAHEQITCDQCQQKFTRPYDLERHMRTHSGAKIHACGGTLKNGETWGCGLKFARPDHVKQHLQSETGRRCLQPKIEEETREDEAMKAERARLGKEVEAFLQGYHKSKDALGEESEDSGDMVKYRELARKHAEIMQKIRENNLSHLVVATEAVQEASRDV